MLDYSLLFLFDNYKFYRRKENLFPLCQGITGGSDHIDKCNLNYNRNRSSSLNYFSHSLRSYNFLAALDNLARFEHYNLVHSNYKTARIGLENHLNDLNCLP